MHVPFPQQQPAPIAHVQVVMDGEAVIGQLDCTLTSLVTVNENNLSEYRDVLTAYNKAQEKINPVIMPVFDSFNALLSTQEEITVTIAGKVFTNTVESFVELTTFLVNEDAFSECVIPDADEYLANELAFAKESAAFSLVSHMVQQVLPNYAEGNTVVTSLLEELNGRTAEQPVHANDEYLSKAFNAIKAYDDTINFINEVKTSVVNSAYYTNTICISEEVTELLALDATDALIVLGLQEPVTEENEETTEVA